MFQLGDCIFVEMDEEKHDQLEVTKSLWESKGALTKFNAVPTDINNVDSWPSKRYIAWVGLLPPPNIGGSSHLVSSGRNGRMLDTLFQLLQSDLLIPQIEVTNKPCKGHLWVETRSL